MPFFNFRRASSAPSNSSAGQPESMEVVRKRAKHRLIGSAVLVLAGVVGFPLLFDTQPRPISVDIPIEIPGKNSVKPLLMPAKPEPATVSSPSGTAAVAASSSLMPKEEIITEKGPASPPVVAVAPVLPAQAAPKTEAKPEPKAQPKPEAKQEPKPDVRPEAKPVAKADDGARAKALLDGQTAAAPATPATSGEDRLVVQVGAFADADKAKEVRQKLEKAGLKTYTQVAETKDGKRIRVRVGPFATKAEADKAATKIKALDLPAAILTL